MAARSRNSPGRAARRTLFRAAIRDLVWAAVHARSSAVLPESRMIELFNLLETIWGHRYSPHGSRLAANPAGPGPPEIPVTPDRGEREFHRTTIPSLSSANSATSTIWPWRAPPARNAVQGLVQGQDGPVRPGRQHRGLIEVHFPQSATLMRLGASRNPPGCAASSCAP